MSDHNHTVGFWFDATCSDAGLAIRSAKTGELMNIPDWMIDDWFAYCPECGEKLEKPTKEVAPGTGKRHK